MGIHNKHNIEKTRAKSLWQIDKEFLSKKSGGMGEKGVKYLEKVPTFVMDGPKSASIGNSNRACMMQHITHSVVDTCFGLVWDFKPTVFFTFK